MEPVNPPIIVGINVGAKGSPGWGVGAITAPNMLPVAPPKGQPINAYRFPWA